ncbi:hypothetical protein [Aridibaculum aurantiacum]|uniref:hypothetical protein n=1 Tax=Aridibaculum aurantiacum TaxID=2810307 RepID=UPI001A9632F1|nr:hypothetical protein [Aridibaculum aurantiacum]
MTAYNRTDLYNLTVQEEARKAFKRNCISKSSYEQLLQQHPVDLYTPNPFVRIGLAILTTLVILASIGLFFLMFQTGGSYGGILILVSVSCYAVLEVLTQQRKHYNSGVDNTLMLGAALLLLGGIAAETHNADRLLSLLSFIVFTLLTFRFANSVMALCAAGSLVMLVFNVYTQLGEFTISTFPYVLIMTAAAIYVVAKNLMTRRSQLIYIHCWQLLEVASLVALYCFGNYFIVDAITDDTYLLTADSPLRMSWFFWAWTVGLPVAYLVRGLKTKNLLLCRLGLIGIAAAVLTYRYYYSILPAEIALIIAGALVLAVSLWLMKYLQQPKHGFVFGTDEPADKAADVEAYLVGEGYAEQPVVEEARIGGGSFGGAGAGSSY